MTELPFPWQLSLSDGGMRAERGVMAGSKDGKIKKKIYSRGFGRAVSLQRCVWHVCSHPPPSAVLPFSLSSSCTSVPWCPFDRVVSSSSFSSSSLSTCLPPPSLLPFRCVVVMDVTEQQLLLCLHHPAPLGGRNGWKHVSVCAHVCVWERERVSERKGRKEKERRRGNIKYEYINWDEVLQNKKGKKEITMEMQESREGGIKQMRERVDRKRKWPKCSRESEGKRGFRELLYNERSGQPASWRSTFSLWGGGSFF